MEGTNGTGRDIYMDMVSMHANIPTPSGPMLSALATSRGGDQYSQSQSPGTSPVLPHSPGPQMHSPPTHHASPHAGSHSNVDVGFFDPAGVHQLGRTLSRMSQDQGAQGTQQERRSVASSSVKTAVDGDKFSLEKVLQDMLQKYVYARSSEGFAAD